MNREKIIEVIRDALLDIDISAGDHRRARFLYTALEAAGYVVVPKETTAASRPIGCVCPPTSEQTCQSVLCPRKGYTIQLAGAMP